MIRLGNSEQVEETFDLAGDWIRTLLWTEDDASETPVQADGTTIRIAFAKKLGDTPLLELVGAAFATVDGSSPYQISMIITKEQLAALSGTPVGQIQLTADDVGSGESFVLMRGRFVVIEKL